MRTPVAMVGLGALTVVAATISFAVASGASARDGAVEAAVIATSRHATTATRPDDTSRVELPWLLPGDTGATVSPDGHSVAFSSARSGSTEIYVVEAASGNVRRLTGNAQADDVSPAWSPDGRRLAWASGSPASHDVFLMNADGTRKQRLVEDIANDVEPAWSPDGDAVAYASDRGGRFQLWAVPISGGDSTLLVDTPGAQRSPAWSPSGNAVAYTGSVSGNADVWIARTTGSTPRRITTQREFDGNPSWSPDGRRLAFVSSRGGARRLWLMAVDGSNARPLARSENGDDQPDWGPVDAAISPSRGSLLPDLDQRAPSGLLVVRDQGRTKLGFTSTVDNVGDGPIHVRGTRVGRQRTMRADQLVHRKRGSADVVAGVGRLAYEEHPPHLHWHLEPYEAYELRRASDDAFMGRDSKSGFCLLDRYGQAVRRPGITPGPPTFLGDCGAGQPTARSVDQGTSVGYTDRYPGFFHGQDIDITGLEPGLYVLAHRANPKRQIRELRYSNNAASALIRLAGPKPVTGAVTVTIVRRCHGSDRCPPR